MITVSQQPDDYMNGFSSQIFSASSNQTGQPNFQYTVVCTDLISNDSLTYQIPPRPDDDLVFDAKNFSQRHLTHDLPINQFGWQTVDGIRKIRVNIGETYGSTPAYASGSNIEYIVWNGIIDWKEYPNYNQDDFVYNNVTENIVYLTDNIDEDTFEGRSNYLYVLGSQVGDTESIVITTYNSAGAVVTESTIANPYEGSSNYREKYLCIDVGHKGLTELPSGLVTAGDYPIITDDVAYYTIEDVYDNGADLVLTPVKTIYIKCERKFDVYTVHYLKKNGAFQTLNFQKLSLVTLNKQQTEYSKLPFTYAGGVYSYEVSSSVRHVLSSERVERVRLNTDWMTPEEVEYHRDLMDSPVIYFDFGSGQDYLRVVLVTDTYIINNRYNEKLFNISVEFEYAHKNTRQLG